MISLRRPGPDSIRDLVPSPDGTSSAAATFGYDEVGATSRPERLRTIADRYTIDRRRFSLGKGRTLFEDASARLFAWRHFEIPWLTLHGAEREVASGAVVATQTRAMGLWFVNPCRVVYREDPSDERRRAAFAYGTLVGHVVRGEERFELSHDPASDDVRFEILAFSRPAHPITRLGRPFLRRVQRRFAGDCAAALARACGLVRAVERPLDASVDRID